MTDLVTDLVTVLGGSVIFLGGKSPSTGVVTDVSVGV